MTPVLVVWQPCSDGSERAARFIREHGLVAMTPQFAHDGDDWAEHAEKFLDASSKLLVLWDPEGGYWMELDDLVCVALDLGVQYDCDYLPDPGPRPGVLARLVGAFS